MEEQLFHKPLIQTSVSLRARLVRAGFPKLGDLQEESGWKYGSNMVEASSIKSTRLLQ
jgi:hypothetical protein